MSLGVRERLLGPAISAAAAPGNIPRHVDRTGSIWRREYGRLVSAGNNWNTNHISQVKGSGRADGHAIAFTRFRTPVTFTNVMWTRFDGPAGGTGNAYGVVGYQTRFEHWRLTGMTAAAVSSVNYSASYSISDYNPIAMAITNTGTTIRTRVYSRNHLPAATGAARQWRNIGDNSYVDGGTPVRAGVLSFTPLSNSSTMPIEGYEVYDSDPLTEPTITRYLLVLGDSRAVGGLADPLYAWADMLQTQLGPTWDVDNQAVGGYTSADLVTNKAAYAARVATAVAAGQTAITVIAIGVNDPLFTASDSPETYFARIAEVAAAVRAAGSKVIAVVPANRELGGIGSFTAEMMAKLHATQNLLREQSYTFADATFDEMRVLPDSADTGDFPDGLHSANVGNGKVADGLRPVCEMLALPIAASFRQLDLAESYDAILHDPSKQPGDALGSGDTYDVRYDDFKPFSDAGWREGAHLIPLTKVAGGFALVLPAALPVGMAIEVEVSRRDDPEYTSYADDVRGVFKGNYRVLAGGTALRSLELGISDVNVVSQDEDLILKANVVQVDDDETAAAVHAAFNAAGAHCMTSAHGGDPFATMVLLNDGSIPNGIGPGWEVLYQGQVVRVVEWDAGTFTLTPDRPFAAPADEGGIDVWLRPGTGPKVDANLTVDAGDTGGSGGGSGADSVTMTITDSANGEAPIPDADVWITSDADGATVVAGTLQTDSSGEVTFLLDAGSTYYLWMQKDGVNSILGQEFVAVAD